MMMQRIYMKEIIIEYYGKTIYGKLSNPHKLNIKIISLIWFIFIFKSKIFNYIKIKL